MSNAPYAEDTDELLAAGPLTHLVTATVTTPAGDTVTLPLLDATVSFDETRAPRVEATLVAHLTPDPALADRVDPRTGCRVQILAGYQRPDTTADVALLADLGLREVQRNRPEDTLQIVARSDESILIDAAPTARYVLTSSTTRDAIVDTIHQVLPAAVVSGTTTVAGPAVTIDQPDTDRWTAVTDFADRLGGVAVYDDGTRAWWVADRPNTVGVPELILTDGAIGTLVGITETVSRDDWFNRAQVVYEWTDLAGVAQRVVATADVGGVYAPTTGNTRVGDFRRDTPTTQAEANKVAATLVARTVTRARSYTLTAPSAYWLRPGDTIGTDESGHPTETHLVSAVSFDLRTGLMTITTRQDETNSLASQGRWDDVAPTVTWDSVAPTITWDTWPS